MAKKDPQINENLDREKEQKTEQDWNTHHNTQDRYPEEAKGIGETDVKNAHATGDGSFGRTDSSLPEENDDEEKKSGISY